MTTIVVINETHINEGNFQFQVQIEISFRPSVYAPQGDGRIPPIPQEGYKPVQNTTFVTYVRGQIFGPSHIIGLIGYGGVPLASYGQSVVESGDLIVPELFTTP